MSKKVFEQLKESLQEALIIATKTCYCKPYKRYVCDNCKKE